MNKRYLWAYQFIRALIIYRYLFEYYWQFHEVVDQAEEQRQSQPFFFHLAAKELATEEEKFIPGNQIQSQSPVKNPQTAYRESQPFNRESIRESTIFRRYLYQTNLYNYRARHYDPIMGRFLQTDPMGYQDSMNLYQAFNMNGVNFVDPYGEAKIRIFIQQSSKGKIEHRSVTIPEHMENGKKIEEQTKEFLSMNWQALSKLAKANKHSLEMIYDDSGRFDHKHFRESLGADVANQEETWTFIIGHSGPLNPKFFNKFDKESKKIISKKGMSFGTNKPGYFGGAIYQTKNGLKFVKDESANTYIGYFGCGTNDFSDNFVYGKKGTFFIEGYGQYSNQYNVTLAAYELIKALISGELPDEAAKIGTENIQKHAVIEDNANRIKKNQIVNPYDNRDHQIIYKENN